MGTLWMILSLPLGKMSNLSQFLSIAQTFLAKCHIQVFNGKGLLVIDNLCMSLLLGYRNFSGSGSTLVRNSNFSETLFLFMAIWLKFGAMWLKRLNLSLILGFVKSSLWSINSKLAPNVFQLPMSTILLVGSTLKLVITNQKNIYGTFFGVILLIKEGFIEWIRSIIFTLERVGKWDS